MKPEVVIRPATPSDAASMLAQIHNSYENDLAHGTMIAIDDTATKPTIDAAISGDGACAFVADDENGKMVGFTLAFASPSLFNFSFLTVAPLFLWVATSSRGKGVGSKLTDALIGWATDNKASVFVLGNTKGHYDAAVGRICKRRRFDFKEVTFFKKLGGA